MLVFIFFIFYLSKMRILNILKWYSYVAYYITLISIIIGILVALNLLTSYSIFNNLLPNYLKVYGLVFYAQSSPLDFFDFPLFRLQGLSIEAGIFAIFLFIPTLYFLIIKKSIIKYSVLFFGMIWTYSFPPFLFLFLIVLLIKKIDVKQMFVLFLSLIVFVSIVLITKKLEEKRIEQKHYEQYNKKMTLNNKTFVELRSRSLNDRTDAIENYIQYIRNQDLTTILFGLGAANSTFIYEKTIANGYLFKLIDSGIVGLLFYAIAAFLLIYISIKNIINLSNNSYNGLIFLLSIATIFLVSVSILRQPFDSSYFQMFVYASLFYLTLKENHES